MHENVSASRRRAAAHRPTIAQHALRRVQAPRRLLRTFTVSGLAPMHSNSNVDGYSQLTDGQLRAAIRFAEKRIRWADEDHVALQRVYRAEIAAMRKHLIDRLIGRLITTSTHPSAAQVRDLRLAIEQRALLPSDVAMLVRATTKGRTDQLDSLTEVEAVALSIRLEQQL